MSEQADAGVGTKRTASPMSGLSPPAKRLTQDVKTDYEILTIAMRDIATVKAALASKTPVQSLRKATNLISAYKHFMYKGRTKYKGRTVQLVYRPWEKKPTSKEFGQGLHRFSEMVEECSDLDMESETAKAIRIGQLTDQDMSKRWNCINERMKGVEV